MWGGCPARSLSAVRCNSQDPWTVPVPVSLEQFVSAVMYDHAIYLYTHSAWTRR